MLRHALAAAFLTIAQAAPAQPDKPCLTRAEAGDFAVFVLPAFIEGVGRKCSAALPAGAFLITGSSALAERIRGEGAGRKVGARTAIGKMAGAMPEGISDETMMKLFEEGMTGALVSDLKLKDCGAADRLLGALAPLPAANFGAFVGAFLELGMAGDANAPFRMCEDAGS